ncbi:MAG: hypothetical protein A3H91_02540 [Gammaproteobacteria bacterium RIFCSPLOWO2_02_FULL_61_13]|nr:MAG: hypothetical protein A3H91_02540 [Gammaproteobacteria bacterium RIFCSPLOWO2_02_FULL_61_13]
MRRVPIVSIALLTLFLLQPVVAGGPGPPRPARMGREDLAGGMFALPGMIKSTHDGNTTLDITSLKSSDGNFASGMYRSGKVRAEITKPYGVDEFMYFLDGGVTLTSGDGTVQAISAGEAVTIPKEWTGVWETDGYTKIWVIYSDDGSGL